MNLVHIGKISCLCLLSTCICAVFIVLRASIRQYIPDLLPNRLCRPLQISAKHCRLVSVPPLTQGSILGPLLSIIFVDDISQDLKNQSIWYVDYATIMSFVKSSEYRLPAAASPNQNLAKIEKGAKTWNVLFGTAKCKTTTISNQRDADGNYPPLHFFSVTLEEADSVDLLGLTLNNNLSWNQVVTKMSKTASQRLGFLRRVRPYIVPAQRAVYIVPLYCTWTESHHLQSHDTIQSGICQQCLDWCNPYLTSSAWLHPK